jgi:hypothetical protein
MTTTRQPLYQRLPEIYKIRDEEQLLPGQLKAFLGIIDTIPANIRDNIEALYHDFFIDTCAAWLVPYVADLLGTSHLAGDPWTLRADVARTINHRRRKGTLGAIESLTYALSGWAVHTVELRECLAWSQHLNHQRPYVGGQPPIPFGIASSRHICGAVRGGTIALRDPATLSFFNGPFDLFAHVIDIKPPGMGAIRYNLPNLAIFIWRLKDYTVPVTRPVLKDEEIRDLTAVAGPQEANYALRYDLHPLAEPMVLYNTHRFQADAEPPDLTQADAVPGPMPRARLSEDAPAGNPAAYVALDLYQTSYPQAPVGDRVGLNLHIPKATFPETIKWKYRGANLCAWEDGLVTPLKEHEIVIDSDHGRMLIGVGGSDKSVEAEPMATGLFVSTTYGFSGSTMGSTGAHPIMRLDTPKDWDDKATSVSFVNYHLNPTGLQDELNNLPTNISNPVVIEIQDSMIHELDIAALSLSCSLWIRAASGQRPIIRIKRPLKFFSSDVVSPEGQTFTKGLNVKLEGLYITWDKASPHFGTRTALIKQAAVNQLIIEGCTLDPGNYKALNSVRQPVRHAMRLTNSYGFTAGSDEAKKFDQTPVITINHSVSGPMAIDNGYLLSLNHSIVDAGSGVGENRPKYAVRAATTPGKNKRGPVLTVNGMTCYGRMQVESACGQGGIWVHSLEVYDNQQGCIKFSYFCGKGDRLPQHQACVLGTEAELSFTSDIFGQAGYGQLHLRSDEKILEQGPNGDAMGAFGYLLNTHKWKNINIRYREYMPVGIRSILT